jgi:hypothetical protein
VWKATAILLGLGASYRGTKDLSVSPTFLPHIAELRQFESDTDFLPRGKSSAILGIALPYEKSSNRHFTETFAALLGKSAPIDFGRCTPRSGRRLG